MQVKERIYLFVNPDGSLTGGTGGFSYTNKQFTLQNPSYGKIPFDYTVIDAGNIRVKDTGTENAWANGIWIKRSNIRGTAVNHRIIGYWEGQIDSKLCVLYFAGRDIVPKMDMEWFNKRYAGQLVEQDGWLYDYDKDNNLSKVSNLFFNDYDGGSVFVGNPPGFDGLPQAFKFNGNDLIVEQFRWETPSEIRYVRK